MTEILMLSAKWFCATASSHVMTFCYHLALLSVVMNPEKVPLYIHNSTLNLKKSTQKLEDVNKERFQGRKKAQAPRNFVTLKMPVWFRVEAQS